MRTLKSIFLPHAFTAVFAFGGMMSCAQAHDSAESVTAASTGPSISTPAEAVSGVVKDLVIDNRVTQSTSRYVGLQLDDGRKLSLDGPGVELLARGARVQATGQRSG